MRTFTSLLACKTGKKEPIPFQERLPLQLKNAVSGKGDKSSEVCCLHELSVMLACFKTNEFDQSLCAKEIKGFQKCYIDNLKGKQQRKEKEGRGILVPGERNLSHKQVNTLLRKFPNFK